MVASSDIRSAIGDYLEGKFSFDAFENWLISNTKDIHTWGDFDSKYLVSSIDLEIAEYVLGYSTESELRNALQTAANTYGVNLSSDASIATTASATKAIKSPVEWQIPPAGKPLVTASELSVPR